MKLFEILPIQKDEIQKVILISKLDFDTVRPISSSLLSCLQDLHWPIAEYMEDYLRPHTNKLVDEIIDILNSNDYNFMYNVIACLMLNINYKLDNRIIKELKRLRDNSNTEEINEGLNKIANKILVSQDNIE